MAKGRERGGVARGGGKREWVHVGGMRVANREFTVTDEYRFNRAGAIRWILSHLLRYKRVLAVFVLGTLLAQILAATVPQLTGAAFTAVARPHPDAGALLRIALSILAVVLALLVVSPSAAFARERLAQ